MNGIHQLINELNEAISPIKVPLDGKLSAVLKHPAVDLLALDDLFDQNDSNYDARAAIYKGKRCSMAEYVTLKYGEHVKQLIDEIIMF